MSITIYTDGSSRGNPGPGGYGAVLLFTHSTVYNDQKVVELGGREDQTTNNRMELRAAVEALAYVEDRKISGAVEIYTDSAYVLHGITGWVFGWEKNGWKTSNGDPVLNQELWKSLSSLAFRIKARQGLVWTKVKGHSGVFLNERADILATKFADAERPLLFTGSFTEYEKLFRAVEFSQKTNPTKKSGKAYSYVSCINGQIFVDTTWAACEKRVKGTRAPKYKKVFSEEEQNELIKLWSE